MEGTELAQEGAELALVLADLVFKLKVFLDFPLILGFPPIQLQVIRLIVGKFRRFVLCKIQILVMFH